MNRSKGNVIGALLICTCFLQANSQTEAGSTTSFVPISSGTFDDPSLTGFTTYAYRVTTDVDWTNSDLGIYLTSGTLNHVQPTGPFGGSLNQLNGLGDTAVFSPLNNLGDLTGGLSGPSSYIGFFSLESPTQFYSLWFNTTNNNIGTFDIGMITLSNDANGSLAYRTITGLQQEDGPSGVHGASPGNLAPDYSIVNGQIVDLVQNPSPVPWPFDPKVPPPPETPTISTEFVQVNSGAFDDPSLSDFNTFAMRVTSNDDWVRSALDIHLIEGTFNHINPGPLQTKISVNGLGDTAIMAPSNALGDLAAGFKGNIAFNEVDNFESPTDFVADWYSTDLNDIGTFDVAMITLSKDARGVLKFLSTSSDAEDQGELTFDNGGIDGLGQPFYIRNGQIYTAIPEPGSVALSLIAGVCLLTKRTKN